jgi:hypothetical protein
MSKKVKVTPVSYGQVEIDSLEEIQGGLKTLTKERFEKLKKEILKTGFAFPLFIWKGPNKSLKIIGGNQRVRVLKTMRKMGYVVPKIPAVFIHADNEREAMRRVIQDAQVIGEFDEDGLAEFLNKAQIEIQDAMESFAIPEGHLSRIFASLQPDEKQVPPEEEPKNIDRTASDGVIKVQLTFDEETHRKFIRYCDVLSHKYDTSSVTDVVLKSLEADFNG